MFICEAVKRKISNLTAKNNAISYNIICDKKPLWLINDIWFLLRDQINNKTRL